MTFLEDVSRVIASNPRKIIACAIAASLVVSLVDWRLGNFKIDMENRGWKCRGTVIGKRGIQASIFWKYRKSLFNDETGELWNNLISTTIDGYLPIGYNFFEEELNAEDSQFELVDDRRLKSVLHGKSPHHRMLNGTNLESIPFQCNTSWYNSDFPGLKRDNFNAIWKVKGQKSVLDIDVMLHICNAEQSILDVLKENALCDDCIDGKCLPPSSLVSLFRSYVGADIHMNCEDLSDMYREFQSLFAVALSLCITDIRSNYDPISLDFSQTTQCLPQFKGHMIDHEYYAGNNYYVTLTASSFPIAGARDQISKILFRRRDQFPPTETSLASARYDMHYRIFYEMFLGEEIYRDLAFAFASSVVTVLAILIHTKSVWLTAFGLLQIFLAIPWAYFVYHFIFGLSFFPILNLIAIFVSAALGADDLFVAVDKWKNSRTETPFGSTADIAAKTLPDAAGAMILTTATTVVAFFGTAICPVAPIFCFAIFCGLTITFNYVLNCTFVFPALCIYDGWLQNGNEHCLITFKSKNTSIKVPGPDKEVQTNPFHITERQIEEVSFIHRILICHYNFVHIFSKLLLLLSMAIVCVSAIFGSQIPQPESNTVTLLPSKNQYQQFEDLSMRLLDAQLVNSVGTSVDFFWGILPKDTGRKDNPDTLSKLSLDDDFDPSSEEAQVYLLNFCERLYNSEFAKKPGSDFLCPMARFNNWLTAQASLPLEDQAPDYLNVCRGASSLPISQEDFHSCMIYYSKYESDEKIISHPVERKVKIIQTSALSSALFTSKLNLVGEEYKKFEHFTRSEAKTAPMGVNKFFHTSPTWWWYDTSRQMQLTALTAATIALGFSAFLVLVVSKSFLLMLFAALSILFVLSTTAATLVGIFSWSLGLLESICFAILIGISCDFVIHLSHSYFRIPGVAERCERTKRALIHMGPSVLASAATTFFSAVMMLFCEMTFFPLFAEMLLFTIVYAVLGSLIVYVLLIDLFGPSEPTKGFSRVLKWFVT